MEIPDIRFGKRGKLVRVGTDFLVVYNPKLIEHLEDYDLSDFGLRVQKCLENVENKSTNAGFTLVEVRSDNTILFSNGKSNSVLVRVDDFFNFINA